MNQTDILYDIQKKLIGDLGIIIKDIKLEYSSRLNNSWVFDYLDSTLKKLQPAKVDNVDYTRADLEAKLKKAVCDNLDTVQKYVPEIKTEDVNTLISVMGDLYDLIYSRAKAELSSLESKSSNYETSEQLVQSEFCKSKAFSSADEHKSWLSKVSTSLTQVFDYIEDVGKILAQKKGVFWWIKLKGMKFYLKNEFKIDLNLPELATDVSVVKEAIIKAYQSYENKLIKNRYS